MLIEIEKKIYVIRGVKVMLDADLAELYGVDTKRLNEQVRRNTERFPLDFMFQLENHEVRSLKWEKNLDINDHYRYLPFVFTENGVAMLSSVLNSPQAIQVNIAIMRFFSELRNKNLFEKNAFERLTSLENETENNFKVVFGELEQVKDSIKTKLPSRKRKIGLNEKM
jgi:hypothetical protein